MCMIRLHLHMGAGARIGPASDWPNRRPLAVDDDEEVEGVVVVGVVSVDTFEPHHEKTCLRGRFRPRPT